MSLAIDVQRLTKRFDATTALNDISFEVRPGEIMGFLGPNGAGKTTTLRILTGLLTPSAGHVRLNGLDVQRHSLHVRRQLAYLPENVALYPEMRVEEYIIYRATLKGVPGRERNSRSLEAMDRCGITDVRRKLIGRLSKGYRQRVGLADCLVGRPSILILDEPTVGLDPHQIRQTRELIKSLGRSTTILLSTHILPEVEMICDRVTIIDRGAIVAVDTPDNLRRQSSCAQAATVELRGAEHVITEALEGLRRIQGLTVESRVPLEEVFIRLTTKETE